MGIYEVFLLLRKKHFMGKFYFYYSLCRKNNICTSFPKRSIPPNFTENLKLRALHKNFADEETIDGSTISIKMDKSRTRIEF